jgi:zinc transporter ZupT
MNIMNITCCECNSEPAPMSISVAEGNLALAFGLTIGAGLATTIGACLPFCISVDSPRILAASLAGSAGVMVYVR